MSTQATSTPTVFGTLHLGGVLVPAGAGVFDGSGRDMRRFMVPLNPFWIGRSLHAQALVAGTALTNRQTVTFTGL